MKIFIEDIINDVYIVDQKMPFDKLCVILRKTSNNRNVEIKLYDKSISQYLIQMYPIGIKEWKIDYPISQNKIHKQCYATKEQCIAIIRELYEKGNIDDVPGFIDVPIQDFTLDEMIEFKKEEEMMLRGRDPFIDEEKEDLPTETMVPQEKREIVQQPETNKKVPVKKEYRI